MNVRKLLAATSIASSVLPLSASTALASTSRASVSVTQNQASWSSTPVRFEQSALTETTTALGRGSDPCGCSAAWATSKSAGSQVSSGVGTGGQHQRVSSDASLTWADNVWPAKTTATTTGSVHQHQRGWGWTQAMSFEQAAGTWQASSVGGNTSTAVGSAHQKNTGAVGFGAQTQNVQGSTSAQGFSDPPFPRSVSLPFGGRLVTTIQAMIQSVIQF